MVLLVATHRIISVSYLASYRQARAHILYSAVSGLCTQTSNLAGSLAVF